jgi:hypothetical protein
LPRREKQIPVHVRKFLYFSNKKATTKSRKLDDEFVSIPAPVNPQPMVLTERQKERMKERPQVPVTYTAMDQSQDPAGFFMDDASSSHRNKPKETSKQRILYFLIA